jgi:multicomponent Na+:H+ antiporter subunit D
MLALATATSSPGLGGVDWGPLLPLLLLATSLVPAVAIFLIPEEAELPRRLINVAGAVLKVALVGVLLLGVFAGNEYEWRAAFLPGIDLVLRVDPIPLLFISLSALLWLTTTVYAVGYLAGDRHRARFFGFFSLCVTATVGIALAGNLVTFLVFYELLTVTTYPLVVHEGHDRARAGGRAYLLYTVAGGAILLVGIVWLQHLAGPLEFGQHEAVTVLLGEHRTALVAIFVLLVGGLGFKAALVPLHGWLPQAMVAPAPVSALLHAVAVVKAGVYGIVRVVHDLYGLPLADELGVLFPLSVVAAVTIVYGSLRALVQVDLKRRLAYSTVSQLSYIVLGISVVGLTSTAGGLVHLVHQGVMKVTLFYCAGNLSKGLGVTRIADLRGVGREMPWTMAAFTVAALGMIGVPPTAGFVTKWYLGLGAAEAGQPWMIAILVVSSLLNAAYFLPIVARAWFRPAADEEAPAARDPVARARPSELNGWLLLPPLATALSVIGLGLLAGAPASPLSWAIHIASELRVGG